MKQLSKSSMESALSDSDQTAHSGAPSGVFHLSSVLKQRADNSQDAPKRHRTRLALLAATAEQMEKVGYEQLTIEEIVKSAGLARGTFYLHFKNRSDAAWAVRRAYLALMRARRPRSKKGTSSYQKIYTMNLFYLLCYQTNARILSGQESLMHDRPELSHSRDFLNHRYAQILLKDLARHKGVSPSELISSANVLAVRFIIGMADEVLREIYVKDNPYLRSYATDVQQVAEVLTTVWCRALFSQNPEEGPSIL
ncbi:TetR/AcrR family transcriptional regulator [Rhodobacteraceae bacterium LMO-12]|nr:TetR/AcrR family transcriptional regulator [Rhodobacteraceae bacterium LMO-JJ12]